MLHLKVNTRKKLLFVLFVSICFFILPTFFVSAVQPRDTRLQLQDTRFTIDSTSTTILILPDTTNPDVGEVGHIRIYVYYNEWPWSDGYAIKIWFDSSYAQIVNYYDTPDIYYDAHYIPPRAEVTWFFFPDGGVSGSGSETRPYIDLKYIKSGSFTIHAEVYQLYVIYVLPGDIKVTYNELRASTQTTIYV